MAVDSGVAPTTPDSMASSMKPICAIVENASMRFRLVCAIAVRLPITSEPTASTTSICCQSTASGSSPSTSSRNAMAKAASLGTEPMNAATGVGAP